jgi:pimeloyl-ACP methyl ester carboxylesterase
MKITRSVHAGDSIPGALVKIPMPGRAPALDGFRTPAARTRDTLLVFVHGMGSNFYRSPFKWAVLREAAAFGVDALSFNNRGTGEGTQTERFRDCVKDLDAVRAWARAEGYRRMAWLGHSTGCQKCTYYLSLRRPDDAAALILAAPADDLAIVRRECGRAHATMIRRARAQVERGEGDRPDPRLRGFSPRRFLSLALPDSLEAQLFDYSGPMRRFASLRLPVLAVFGTREEYACRPVAEMGERLGTLSRAEAFEFHLVPGADHSYKPHEQTAVRRMLAWLQAHL